ALNGKNAGGEVDLTSFGVGTIDGQSTTSFEIATTTNHNLSWNEFSNLDTLVYQTTGNVELGVDSAKDLSNAELALIGGYANRLFVHTTGDITTTNATIPIRVDLHADFENDGTGSVILNGLTVSNDDIHISAADISGNGTATDAGTGAIFIEGISGQDISVAGSSTFNIEPLVWNNFNGIGNTIIAGAGGTLYWQNNTLAGDLALDASAGAGVVIQTGAFTFTGAHTLQLIGDIYITENLIMTNAGSLLDIDGTLFVGASDTIGGNDSVTISGIWDTAGLTDVVLMGDAADAASLTHIADTDFSLPSILSTNGVNLDIASDGSITVGDMTVGDLLLDYDANNNAAGANMLTLSGTNSVNGLTLSGSSSNDNATWGGSWTIAGDVTVIQTNNLDIAVNALNANSFDFSTTNNIDLGSGANFTMTATGGDIILGGLSTDRNATFTAQNNIDLRGISASAVNLIFQSEDIDSNGSAINMPTGNLTFRQDGVANAISIGDAGTETYNVEANIWDNISAASLTVDTTGMGDSFTFLEDTLPTETTFDGLGGSLTFTGAGQNFTGGYTLTANTDVVMLHNFSTDGVLDINGSLTIGEVGANNIIVAGNWSTAELTGIELAGDNGDTVTLSKLNSADFYLPQVTSTNDVNLVVESIRGVNMIGADVGSLTVNLDT
ncbi:MAG: hypothetical protein R3227_17095, partial [Reinekea sp.]|nr:hypothetical protein [Reinekea sp.]